MSIHQHKNRFVLDEDYRYVYEQTKPEERDPCKFCSECTVFQRVAKDWCQDKLLFMNGTNFEFSRPTNFDFVRTLSKEELAHIFVLLRYDAAEEADWIEWLDMPVDKVEWGKLLKK